MIEAATNRLKAQLANSAHNKWCQVDGDGETLRVGLRGSWRMRNLEEISRALRRMQFERAKSVVIDGSALEEIDTAGAYFALNKFNGGPDSSNVRYANLKPGQHEIFDITQGCSSSDHYLHQGDKRGPLERLGRGAVELFRALLALGGFIAQTWLECLRLLIKPGDLRIKELVVHLEQAGVNAVPIVILLNFLIGVVVAYLSGVQIERYGASIFIVDGVSLATCRELSPILVAIIVAGRSGSAFTAQIGSMKINEEVDALVTLGLSPLRVLVVPRLLALVLFMPLLVFVGDVAGIAGGMLIADLRLGVSGATFIERLGVVLPIKHVIVGMAKVPFFAFFIATIGCHMGLTVENNARSVGTNTTRTVVQSIVSVILLNAGFAVLLSELGI